MRPGKKPPRQRPPELEIEQLLAWADEHHARTGAWPKRDSGRIAAAPRETWMAVHVALMKGHRGLPGGSSLPRLLAAHRDVRNHYGLPRLTREQILAWADGHRARTGEWPRPRSGPVQDAPGETWMAVQRALQSGGRGLPGGSSLVRLLADRRGVRNPADVPALTEEQILQWADACHERTGQWPVAGSGPIDDAPGETWSAIDHALMSGRRGLGGGSSLARLLVERRGVRNRSSLPALTEEQILVWADRHHTRTGQWPQGEPGPVQDAPGETWSALNVALQQGHRGLPGGSSLARLLQQHRGVPNRKARPELSVKLILQWADAHDARHGRWPQVQSGPIEDAGGETWSGVESALQRGTRGLPGGSSLARLLLRYRKVPIRGRRERSDDGREQTTS